MIWFHPLEANSLVVCGWSTMVSTILNKAERKSATQRAKLDALSISETQLFRIEKLKLIVIALCSCLLLICVHLAVVGKYDTVWVLLVESSLAVGCYLLAKHKSLKVGTSAFMLLMAFSCCFIMWNNEGLTDESILAMPCILIFSMLIASFRLTVALLVIFSVNILIIAYVNQKGIYVNPDNSSTLSSGIQIILILVLLTYTVYMISKDLHRLLNKLEKENHKVKQSKEEIIRLQNHDPLTGLPNRVLAKSMFNERAKLGVRQGFKTTLMFIDLDNFKSINDTLGHSCGDEYLIGISDRLSTILRETDAICRLSGDEFVIIAHHEHGRIDASTLAEKVLNALKQPVIAGNSEVCLSASIGIAIAPDNGIEFEELNQKADIAMYRCKESGRDRYRFFCDDMAVDNARQMQISQELRSAIDKEQFSLLYQSKQSLLTAEITGAEALLRWQHPELGNVSPVEFIPIAERAGVIVELGYWVLEEAIKTCRNWHDLGYEGITMSVNVSPIQFAQEDFEERVRALLIKYRFNGKYLVLELTESMLIEGQNDLLGRLQMLRALGVSIAIDDFGTGYSNLAYLQKFDVSILKIDRSFISKMLKTKQDLAIVEAIITMSKSLNLVSVAEGIEHQSELDELIELGCTLGQGYYWMKPLPAEIFITHLRDNQKINADKQYQY